MTENAYIHIPFCSKKCNYCAFISYPKLQEKSAYVEALCAEIKTNYKGEKLNTLYFGGGTPSLLNIKEVEQIFALFNLAKNAEITFEINPNKLKPEYLNTLRKIGINRLSIGAQTFDAQTLKQIGRLHTPNDITTTVQYARKAGFENISLDLIYGLPNQSLADFEFSLTEATKLEVEHVSLYGLKIEVGTEFAKKPPENLPDDDLQADMYLLAGNFLKQKGYEKYEISNFSKNGFFSRHNLNYWNANTYYGFGCGAHGYESNTRYENQTNLEKYIKNPLEKLSKTLLNDKDKLEETIFLGFRKAEGIDIFRIKEKFGYDFEKTFKSTIEKFTNSGHLIKTQNGYALTDEGFLLSNEILCEFIPTL